MRTQQFTRSLIAGACLLACVGAEAATIKIMNRDPAGYGFNDPTPVAPVGGNPGTTLGEQRMYVYRYVADIWEKALDSKVEIAVNAGWEGLTCTATTATLGSASAANLWYGVPNGVPMTWYPQALANKLAGENLNSNPDPLKAADIKTQFNINLGNPGCLDGNTFYLGVDGRIGPKEINFAATLLHELGHGLGFSVLSVSTVSGNRINAAGTAYTADGLPSIWEGFMFDGTAKKTWLNMTSAERRASAINPLQLAWIGPNVKAGAGMLNQPRQALMTTSPAPSGANFLTYWPAQFGATVPASATLGALAAYTTQANDGGPGCSAFNATNAAAARGKIMVISRGTCSFTIKVKNAQNAGAIGVILANTTNDPITPSGADPTINIPVVAVSQYDGAKLVSAIADAVPYSTRLKAGVVTASVGIDPYHKQGTDAGGNPLLYTPGTLVSGSSVSHWDVTASPNLLMEPNINPDLTTTLVPPLDLTLPLLKDIGW